MSDSTGNSTGAHLVPPLYPNGTRGILCEKKTH